MNRCFLCGRQATERHHLIGGTANRKLSEKYGLVVYLCSSCHRRAHDDPNWNRSLKRFGQRMWEEKYGDREAFIKTFGKSWEVDP